MKLIKFAIIFAVVGFLAYQTGGLKNLKGLALGVQPPKISESPTASPESTTPASPEPLQTPSTQPENQPSTPIPTVQPSTQPSQTPIPVQTETPSPSPAPQVSPQQPPLPNRVPQRSAQPLATLQISTCNGAIRSANFRETPSLDSSAIRGVIPHNDVVQLTGNTAPGWHEVLASRLVQSTEPGAQHGPTSNRGWISDCFNNG